MENVDFYKVLEMVFGIAAVVFGVYWAKAKSKLVDVGILLANVNKALEDNVLTQDEMKVIVADVMRLVGREVPK